MENFELKVPPIYAPRRADAYLAEVFHGKFSREEIKSAIQKEKIFLNGKCIEPKTPVREGDVVSGGVESARAAMLKPEAIPLKIIYEDDSLIVVDKAAGMVTHPGAGNKKGTLANALLGRSQLLSDFGGAQRPGIVHRLDKETSGILLVAKNNLAHQRLAAQFASRSLSKTYMALVKGRVEFEEGHVSEPIGRDPKDRRKRIVSNSEAAASPAETRYRVLKRFRHSTLLEIKPLTGRTHQIRVHMKHIGHPVVGDTLYGTKRAQERLMLHAVKIQFLHPKTGKIVEFHAKPPDDFDAVIEKYEERKD